MQNRPDKPGHWWYGTNNGEAVIQYVNFNSEQKLLCYPQLCTLSAIEKTPWFFRWLGPACPPKKVQRYELTYSGLECSDKYDDINDGDWVKYKDVKEYLLDGGDDEE